ncbi:hypothetical protein PV326_012032 [Microctonus aethiopoides]|nr:hypothetical protein PV326_012032 [Microctonus aethiopoides]
MKSQENSLNHISGEDSSVKNDSAFSNEDISSDGSVILNDENSSYLIKQKFRILQGKFCVPRGVIFDEYETLTKDKIREKIQDNMVHTLNFPCPLKFYGGIRRNINSLTTYAKCRYTSHLQQFKFDISNLNSAKIDVFVSSTECTEIIHNGPPIFSTLKGAARDEAKIKMKYISPRMLQLETLENLDPELAQEGYLQKMHRLSTYQKAKSEDNNKNDLQLCSNDVSD